MSDTIGAAVILTVVLGFFGMLGFVIWSEHAMREKCIDQHGTYVSGGTCVFGAVAK